MITKFRQTNWFKFLLLGLTLVLLTVVIAVAPREQAAMSLQLELVSSGLEHPLRIVRDPSREDRFYILEKHGLIQILEDSRILSEPFLDIQARVYDFSELGLLGMAFDPEYEKNGYFYIFYGNHAKQTMLVRFEVYPDDPDRADPSTETLLLWVKHPTGNHDGGNLVFGPDGYLYIGVGDGGDKVSSENSQDLNTLMGKLLRIDVRNHNTQDNLPYDIPPDNPFFGESGTRPEIWAYGLRNPWTFSFDSLTGDLYLPDVGQNHYEELNYQPASSSGGENYGWDIMEGQHCYRPVANCNQVGLVLPVLEYEHPYGLAIVDGGVYRGRVNWLRGKYVFGDFGSGRIWVVDPQKDWELTEMLDTNLAISAFGVDEKGEFLLLDYRRGKVYRLKP